MNEELTEAEKAGKEAVDCIMPGVIAVQLDSTIYPGQPSNDRLMEVADWHMTKHWEELDDAGKLAAFTYLAQLMAEVAARSLRRTLDAFVAGTYDEPFTASGWPLRTDGGL